MAPFARATNVMGLTVGKLSGVMVTSATLAAAAVLTTMLPADPSCAMGFRAAVIATPICEDEDEGEGEGKGGG